MGRIHVPGHERGGEGIDAQSTSASDGGADKQALKEEELTAPPD